MGRKGTDGRACAHFARDTRSKPLFQTRSFCPRSQGNFSPSNIKVPPLSTAGSSNAGFEDATRLCPWRLSSEATPATVDASPYDDATTWIYAATHDATTTASTTSSATASTTASATASQQAQQPSQWICDFCNVASFAPYQKLLSKKRVVAAATSAKTPRGIHSSELYEAPASSSMPEREGPSKRATWRWLGRTIRTTLYKARLQFLFQTLTRGSRANASSEQLAWKRFPQPKKTSLVHPSVVASLSTKSVSVAAFVRIAP
jgi:hypothetical protein